MTVVIPTRNRWQLASTNALPAALAQEDVDLEVIIIDDGSTDDTQARLLELEDHRLRVVHRDFPRGTASARNAGIAKARGEWIAFLDDDDIWSPRKLRTQIDAASSAGVSFVYCAVAILNEEKRVIDIVPAPDPADIEARLLARNVIPAGGSAAVISKNLVRRVGGFDSKLAVLADWDYWIRVCAEAAAAACQEVLVGYVQHPSNMSRAPEFDLFEEFEYLVRKHRLRDASVGASFDRKMLSEWAAWQYRRDGQRVRAAKIYASAALTERRPADLVRAGSVLLGERFMRLGSRIRQPRESMVAARGGVDEPSWLNLYR